MPQPVIAPPTGPASIAWKLLDAAEQRGGTATIRNTVLSGDGPGLYLVHAVKNVEFSNVLKIGPGPLIQLAGVPAAKALVTLRLMHTTCRASGALVRWIVAAEGPPRGRILVEAGDCVFDIVSPQAALFELAGASAHPEWLKSLRMTGEGSLTRPGLEVAAWVSTIDGRVTPLAARLSKWKACSPARSVLPANRTSCLPIRKCTMPKPRVARASLPGSTPRHCRVNSAPWA